MLQNEQVTSYCARGEDALADTEEQCLKRIAEALGVRVGVDAFCGLQPGKSDCAVFDIGYLYTGDQMGFPANNFHFRAKLELYNRNRRQIQRWIMRLVLAFPVTPWQGRCDDLRGNGPAMILRLAPENGAVGEVSTITVKQSEKDPGRETFYCAANFDVVFSAAERQAEEGKEG